MRLKTKIVPRFVPRSCRRQPHATSGIHLTGNTTALIFEDSRTQVLYGVLINEGIVIVFSSLTVSKGVTLIYQKLLDSN